MSKWMNELKGVRNLLMLYVYFPPQKYFMVLLNTVLLLCCLACAALMGYNTYEEVVLYDALEDTGTKTTPSLGTILTGLEALLALFILLFIIIWTCAIGCSGSDDYPVSYPRNSVGFVYLCIYLYSLDNTIFFTSRGRPGKDESKQNVIKKMGPPRPCSLKRVKKLY